MEGEGESMMRNPASSCRAGLCHDYRLEQGEPGVRSPANNKVRKDRIVDFRIEDLQRRTPCSLERRAWFRFHAVELSCVDSEGKKKD